MKFHILSMVLAACVLTGCANDPACWSGLQNESGEKIGCAGGSILLKHKLSQALSEGAKQ